MKRLQVRTLLGAGILLGPSAIALKLPWGGASRPRRSVRGFSRASSPPRHAAATLESADDAANLELPQEEASTLAMGAWLPIGSALALTGLGPTRVEVVGEQLVVWQHAESSTEEVPWSVQVRFVCVRCRRETLPRAVPPQARLPTQPTRPTPPHPTLPHPTHVTSPPPPPPSPPPPT